MNGVVQLGPLAMATDRLMAVAGIWAFVATSGAIASRMDERAVRVGMIALGVGIVAARLSFVFMHREAFLEEPLSALAVWQGGFSVLPGLAAAALVIVLMLGRRPAALAMILVGGVLSLAHWGASNWLAPESRPMPRVTIADMTGNSVELGAAGKPMVINLWATWCPPCRREMPMMIHVARNSEIPVLLVNQGEDLALIRGFLRKERLSEEPILIDPTGALGQSVAAPALPTTLFVNAHGKIVEQHVGEISRATLMAAMRDLQRN